MTESILPPLKPIPIKDRVSIISHNSVSIDYGQLEIFIYTTPTATTRALQQPLNAATESYHLHGSELRALSGYSSIKCKRFFISLNEGFFVSFVSNASNLLPCSITKSTSFPSAFNARSKTLIRWLMKLHNVTQSVNMCYKEVDINEHHFDNQNR